MKIRLIRAARIRHEAGEIVEVSPAEAGFLLSTGSAATVETAQTRETPEEAAPEVETPENADTARETPEIMKARKVVPTRKTRK